MNTELFLLIVNTLHAMHGILLLLSSLFHIKGSCITQKFEFVFVKVCECVIEQMKLFALEW